MSITAEKSPVSSMCLSASAVNLASTAVPSTIPTASPVLRLSPIVDCVSMSSITNDTGIVESDLMYPNARAACVAF